MSYWGHGGDEDREYATPDSWVKSKGSLGTSPATPEDERWAECLALQGLQAPVLDFWVRCWAITYWEPGYTVTCTPTPGEWVVSDGNESETVKVSLQEFQAEQSAKARKRGDKPFNQIWAVVETDGARFRTYARQIPRLPEQVWEKPVFMSNLVARERAWETF